MRTIRTAAPQLVKIQLRPNERYPRLVQYFSSHVDQDSSQNQLQLRLASLSKDKI